MDITIKHFRYVNELKKLKHSQKIVELFGIEEYAKIINKLINRIKESSHSFSVNGGPYRELLNNDKIILALILFNVEYTYSYGLNEEINNIISDIDVTKLDRFDKEETDELVKKVVSVIYEDAFNLE